MTEEIDAIVFDAGGTLIDMVPSRQEIISTVLAEHGHTVDIDQLSAALVKADRRFDDELRLLDGKDEAWFWEKYDDLFLEELGIEDGANKFMKAIHERFHRYGPNVENWVAYPDTKPILAGLKDRDFKIGMVSNATGLLRRVLDNLGLSRYFDFVIISQEVGVRKPSPKIFEQAVKAAGTSPNRTLYVGDKLCVDVRGAMNAGMNAVLVDRDNVFPDARCIRTRDLNLFRTYF